MLRACLAVLVVLASLCSDCVGASDESKKGTAETARMVLPCLSDGSTFDLGQQKANFVVLHFLLKTECPYCLKYTREYSQIAKDETDVVHVFLKPDDEAEIRKWMDHLDAETRKELPMILHDAGAKQARAFRIPDGYRFHGQSVHYPALIILGPDRKEVFRHVGKSNADRCTVETYREQMAKLKQ